MVDYSKWDKLAMEVDEEEDDANRAPKVTKLEGKTEVRVGKGGELEFKKVETAAAAKGSGLDYSKWDKIEVSDSESEEEEEEGPEETAPPPVAAATSSVVTLLEPTSLDENGASREQYYWSQTPSDVTVHFKVPPATRGKDVTITLDTQTLSVSISNTPLNPALTTTCYPIDVAPTADPTDIDWEILTHNSERLVRVTFKKKSPSTVTPWWDRIYPTEDRIPPSAIKGRSTAKAAESKRVWDEAHKQFREKIKQMKKHPVG
eukprot:TRINITY_DN26480_c0_g1_i1.p2 TRINITY_DN26480_c0_g1~~TRINITY_DN26480_c0_g1_i1.p2  ORF type:complete len:261 (+),score=82.13 TRINITY_DN26480_c0_g1_i1:1057-1839(+)